MANKETPATSSNQPAPSRGPMIVLIAGAIAVAALLGWALTRSVEPAAPEATAVTAPSAQTPPTGTSAPAAQSPSALPNPGPDPNTGVPRVSPQEMKTLVDRNAVTVVDVRDSVSYSNGHIPGAIHIPFARVEAEAKRLPKDKPIITYCT